VAQINATSLKLGETKESSIPHCSTDGSAGQEDIEEALHLLRRLYSAKEAVFTLAQASLGNVYLCDVHTRSNLPINVRENM